MDDMHDVDDLGFSIANTNRKRKIFAPYEDATAAWQPEHTRSDEYAANLAAMPQINPRTTVS